MRMIITAGGTGGHIMPAVAIAEAIRELSPGTRILFVGTDRGMEERIAGLYSLDFTAIRALGIKGKSPVQVGRAAATNTAAFFKALKIVRAYRPDWVVGTGGYITGMVVLAGYLQGAACAIQEQNSIPGLTNQILSRFASRIFLAFPDTRKVFPQRKSVVSGNPVRAGIIQGKKAERGRSLLILGGSLGAGSINEAAVEALRILKQEGLVPDVVHQCGPRDYDRVVSAYRDMGLTAEVHAFIDDMAPVYNRASMAICRCGGLTLAELSAMGIPAIMVPYPHAADDHQTANARYVESHGGGWIIPDRELSPQRLAGEIKARFFERDTLEKAASCIAGLGLGQGSQFIAQEILRCSGA